MTKKKPASTSTPKSIILLGVGVLVLAFAVGYTLSRSSSPVAKGPIQTKCDGTCVAVYNDKADPDVLTVTAGSYVQFNAADGQMHNLSIGGDDNAHHEDIEVYSSGDFKGDEAWRVQFKKDGAYTFKDKYHPKVSINVVVYTPGKDYRIKN